MAEKVNLKNMRCPTCGAPLKAENATDVITCVYCENSIVPVAETAQVAAKSEAVSVGFSSVRVEGIKTSSSALAYMEQFFEEYDWEAFTYAQALSVAEIDKLAKSCRASSADDKNTWIVCFKAISVPFINKINGFNQILSSVIEEYKKDNLDAYSKFDAYKRIGTKIFDSKDAILANLEKISANAVKYGASAEEADAMRADIENIRISSDVNVYGDVEDIPEIRAFINEKNAEIVRTLAAKGIDAKKEYNRAKQLIESESYVEALNVLISLEGYSDTNALIEKIDQYYLISDVLEIEGNLYYFKKRDGSLNLYPTENGKVSNKALIKNIGQIITNYANILYYLDNEGILKKFNLSDKVEEKIHKRKLLKEQIFVYGRRAFLVEGASSEDSYSYSTKKNILELDMTIGVVRVVLEGIKDIVSFNYNKLVFIQNKKEGKANAYGGASLSATTKILNVDTMDVIDLGDKDITIEGFTDSYVVYTKDAPNKFNKNLFIKDLYFDEPEKLVEQNIYKFCAIISDRLFYYVGNSSNSTLINIDLDGTDRREWPMSISSVLFEQGGWIYFIRKAGYNSVLCKSRLDGSKYCIIAADIDKFIEIKNGYLYYINFDSSLVKVRMDGSNLQELCEDVEEVLQVQEDRIVFVSLDDKIKASGFENMTAKAVKSIYAVDFSGSGIMKLAYNVKSAKLYDENTVYYVAEQSGKKTAQGEKKPDNLLRLRLSPYMTENLLVMDVPLEEQKDMSKATIALIVMGVAFFIAFIGLMAGSPGLFLFATLVAIVALSVGLIIKYNSKYKNEMISAIDGLFKPESSEAMKKINKYMKDFIDKLSK